MCECVIQFKLGKLASETSNSYSAHSKHEGENISFSNWLPYGNRQRVLKTFQKNVCYSGLTRTSLNHYILSLINVNKQK